MSTPLSECGKPDLTGRADVITLVNHFYGKIQRDDLVGPVFSEVAKVDWDTHLPVMYDFWQTILFREEAYKGNPLGVHTRLAAETPMDWPKFERWLALFHASLDELFAGKRTEHAKRAADDMANVLYSRINGVVDRRFDPARLTPEQRARYTRYRVEQKPEGE